MSREFDGVDDEIISAPGAVSNSGGPLTVLSLWRPLSVKAAGLLKVREVGGGQAWAVNPFSDGNVYFSAGSGFVSAPYATDGWRIDGFTHVSNGMVRSHRYSYTTDTWAHADVGSHGNRASPTSLQDIWHGFFVGGERMHGRLAVQGVWNAVLSDATIEGMKTALANWLASSPSALWAYNQANVTDPVLDLTGGGADQTSRVGTTVSADEPAGFSYGASTTPVSSDTDLRWRSFARVQTDVEARWRVLAQATKDVDLRWRTRALVSKDTSLLWRMELPTTPLPADAVASLAPARARASLDDPRFSVDLRHL